MIPRQLGFPAHPAARPRWTAFVACLSAMLATALPCHAQTTSWSVSTSADLTTALAGAFANSVANPATRNTITLTGSISGTSQWIVNANLDIVGNGNTINMNNTDRAFFIAGGNVFMSNLAIAGGNATGGTGGLGAGGGAGLGGAIFVGSGTYMGWTTDDNPVPVVAALGISAPTVTLAGVVFQNNRAVGGNGGAASDALPSGGGGGMGGNGGNSNSGEQSQGGGGGGGFGNGASGGNNFNTGEGSEPGSAGSFVNVISGSFGTSGGAGGNGGGTGGAAGGGGGSGALTTGFSGGIGSGGAGGVGGGRGYFQDGTPPTNGGNGGFGGGGGGNYMYYAGPGGFGGGGGAAKGYNGGNGGFGGGGGNRSGDGGDSANSIGGFGGSGGGYAIVPGGAGMGAGGAIFVMAGANVTVQGGTFSGNSVTGGSGLTNGSAYGADVFLGTNVTFAVNQGDTLSAASLGGAGNLADPNVASHANDPNAQGGVIKTGLGTLVLTGTSYYSGPTTVHAGTLALGPGATEQGTSTVTVGQNPGDNATLALDGSSFLVLGGWNFSNPSASTDLPVMIAESAGSTGQVVIGSGSGSNGAFIAARTFTGGSGTASVVFTQHYSAETGTNPVYPFNSTLTGSLGLVQQGLGTTLLQPLYGPNTFTGPVTVSSGTLATTGTAAALAGTAMVNVMPGGVLSLGQTDGVYNLAQLTLAGGMLQTGTSLTEAFGTFHVSGTIASVIDFSTFASTLTFATLGLAAGSELSIWNYAGADDSLFVATGTAAGDLAQITFYADSGSTLLGYGGFDGLRLVPVAVPEPGMLALAVSGLAAWLCRARRPHDLRRQAAVAKTVW